MTGDALTRVQDALTRAGRQWKAQGAGYSGQCPAHDDQTASLTFGPGTKVDGAVVMCQTGCSTEDVAAALGLSLADLYDAPQTKAAKPQIVATYDYTDEHGHLLYQKVRYAPKDFRVRRPDGMGGWIWSIGDAPRVLYRLPEVVAGKQGGRRVILVEGEKDADRLVALNEIATCNFDGASKAANKPKWRDSYSDSLIGAHVLIIADNDVGGIAHARAIEKSLTGKAASITVRRGAVLDDHADVSDHLDAGYTLDQLIELPPVETNGHGPPPSTTDDSAADASGDELHRGQLRFAQRFAGQYGGQLLHAHGIGWHYYRSRWVPCSDGSEVRAVTKLLAEALRELPEMDKPAREALYKDVRKVESAAGVAGVLTLAGNLRPITVAADRLDGSPFLLNTPTGTVNMETGAMHSHLPFDYLTKMTRGHFDPDARSSVFEDFLAAIQPQEEMRAFLARSLGSALLGLVRDHVMFIWHGAGANGKSTLRDAVAHALGDYSVDVPSDLLLQSKYGNAGQAPERMRLKGTRVAFCSEISKGARLDEATMKKLTGGEPVNAKLLYKNPIQFDPSHTLIMLTNHLPQVRGDDPATWRRLMAVPFGHVVPPEKRDLKLPEKLRAVPDAVLAWIWRGWLDYQEKKGLAPPAAVIGATGEYQKDSDILARFLGDGEAVTVRNGMTEASAVLYEGFTTWARAQGEHSDLTHTAFSTALVARGFVKSKSDGVMTWSGIALTAPRTVTPPEQERY